MGKNEDFFARPQAAAVFKHAVLRNYAPIFVGKVGSTAPDGRVVILDGYAGPGRYGDGSPGSPVVLATIAGGMPWRKAEVICVEKDPKSCDQLRAELEHFAGRSHVLEGTFEERIDDCLSIVGGGAPLLAFLDPFGRGAPMGKLKLLLDRDPAVSAYRSGPPTEILMNLSLSGLRRNAGHLGSTSTEETYGRARESLLTKMDDWLGGDWWREIWEQTHPTEPIKAHMAIVEGYLGRLAGGRAWYYSGAADSWKGSPAYLLALFTNSDHGTWAFNDALSRSRPDHYGFTHPQEQLFDPFPEWGEDWVRVITTNLQALLEQGPVAVRRNLSEILGSTLGWARETHVRKAIKALYKAGLTSSNGVGKVFEMKVMPP